jgi:hypothetical protein
MKKDSPSTTKCLKLASHGVFDAAIQTGAFSMLPGGLSRILPTTQMCISMSSFVLAHDRLSQSPD